MTPEEQAALEEAIATLAQVAHELGLRPPEVRFEAVPAEAMYELAAYHFPARFPHWTHGAQYCQQR